MIARLRTWYDALSLREKRLILVAAALAVVTILWLGIIRPVGDGLATSRERHANAVVRLAETEARVRAVQRAQRNRPPPLEAPLEAIIRDRASTAGFVLANVTPQAANQVQIAITSARPAALFAWIADLEAAGILVDQLSTTDNGDQTVSAQLSLKAQGI